MRPVGNLGLYFETRTFSHLAVDGQTMSPSVLSRFIRSGAHSEEICWAIDRVEEATNENLCDALDRGISIAIFQDLVVKVKNIDESTFICALHQSRITEFLEMFKLGKTTVSLESLLKKVQYKSDMETILLHYPELRSKVEADPELRGKFVLSIPVFGSAPAVRCFEPEEDEAISFLLSQENRKESSTIQLKARALEAIKQRDFFNARMSADAIPDKTYRNGTMADIFTKCFEYADREAIECAFAITKMHKEEKDGYIYGFLEECTKLKDKKMAKEMSIQAANELENRRKKDEWLQKITLIYEKTEEVD